MNWLSVVFCVLAFGGVCSLGGYLVGVEQSKQVLQSDACPNKSQVELFAHVPPGEEDDETREFMDLCGYKYEPNDVVASNSAINALAARLSIDAKTINKVSNELTDWPDSCLGVPQRDTLCTKVVTPGYKVIMEHGGTQYEYHTDLGGIAIPAY